MKKKVNKYINKAKKGKQISSIITNDPNDPRLKTYQDSSIVANESAKFAKRIEQEGEHPNWYNLREFAHNQASQMVPAYKRLLKLNKVDELQPKEVRYKGEKNNAGEYLNSEYYEIYQQPQQPVQYQPQKKDNIQSLPTQGYQQFPTNFTQDVPQPIDLREAPTYSGGVMSEASKRIYQDTPETPYKYKNGGKMKKYIKGSTRLKKADQGLTWNNQIPQEVEQGRNVSMNQIDPATQPPIHPNSGLPGVTPESINHYYSNDPPQPVNSQSRFSIKANNKWNPSTGVNIPDVFAGTIQGINAIIPNTPISNNQKNLVPVANTRAMGTQGSSATYKEGGKVGTKLLPIEEKQYQVWKKTLPKRLQSEGDYDLRGFYKENPKWTPSDPKIHMGDKFKLPNHSTFSDESIYANPTNKDLQGHWNDSMYVPYNPQVKDTLVDEDEQGKGVYKIKMSKKVPVEMKNGGYINKNKNTNKVVNYLEYGGEVPLENGGGLQVDNDNYEMLSPKTAMIKGKKHEEGGTKINFNGQEVEAELGEPIHIGNDGQAVVMGNMKIPGTNTKFKKAGEYIGRMEKKNSKMEKKGTDLLNNADPYNYYSAPSFNTGKVLQDASLQTEVAINKTKESLANMQQNMLDLAKHSGQDPKMVSKYFGGKAKFGITVPKAKNGVTLEEQEKMMQDHPNWVEEALNKYGKPKAGKFDDGLEGPRTDFVRNYISKKSLQEPKYKSPQGDFDNDTQDLLTGNTNIPNNPERTSIGQLPLENAHDPWRATPNFNDQQAQDNINNRTGYKDTQTSVISPTSSFRSYGNRLGISDILPELSEAFDKVTPVPGQTYSPNLENPYKVSYQDLINTNQGDYNAVQRAESNNPAALGAINASKYDQNNKIYGEEFRQNQGIENQVNNQNTQIMNQAQQTNLGYNDIQMQRQQQALENTKANRLAAMNSISGKISSNRSENAKNQLYTDIYHESYDPKTGFTRDPNYYAQFSATPSNIANTQASEKTKKYNYNSSGKKTEEVDEDNTKAMGGMMGGLVSFRGGSGSNYIKKTKKKK